MKVPVTEGIMLAKQLIDDFLSRTGITGNKGDVKRRYLWTDAFAVQACFALAHVVNEKSYHYDALQLIRQVHNILGKHRADDSRTGWISGLPDEEGENHPTINGLRIGKELPERPLGELHNQQLEWERDGQYFHYLTRWFNALLVAYEETGEMQYARWAAELIKAGEKFLIKKGNNIRMVWKMNIDLSQPRVESMGAHDPLEALICLRRAENTFPEMQQKLAQMNANVEKLCHNMNWFSHDPLGIGGLFLSTKNSIELVLQGEEIPAAIRPEYLYAAARAGLKAFAEQDYEPHQPQAYRLAFRECGMALGFQTLFGLKETCSKVDIDLKSLEKYAPLIIEITDFWSQQSHRTTKTWMAHQDINAVMLSGSLLSQAYPHAF